MAKRYRRRFTDKPVDRDPSLMWIEFGGGYVVPFDGRFAAVGDRLIVYRGPDILLHTELVMLGQRVEQGRIVDAASPSWAALRNEVLSDPELLNRFPMWPRRFEEFVAGGYLAHNYSDVILSPASGDGGFDVAASIRGKQILDEAKAYNPELLVKHPTVRAALGLKTVFPSVDQVRVTTTSFFAPRVRPDFAHLIPETLVLRDRRYLLLWLRSIGPYRQAS